MLRNPDKWVYCLESLSPVAQELSTDKRYNIYGWHWDKGYDNIESLRATMTRGEAIDKVFNNNYAVVRYLATQHLPWENHEVGFIKHTTLKREVMDINDIWGE